MSYVLITVLNGIIKEVIFYTRSWKAIQDLISFALQMDPDHQDAAVYGPEGLIMNAKLLMDAGVVAVLKMKKITNLNAFYVIVNPFHSLGYLVMTMDEPIGYPNPLEALTVLEKVRKEHGCRICLFRAEPVVKALAKRKDLETFNANRKVVDFDYGLISEYIDQKDGAP